MTGARTSKEISMRVCVICKERPLVPSEEIGPNYQPQCRRR